MNLLVLLLQLVGALFLARVVFSWIRPGPTSAMYPIARFVDRVTEPIVAPIRRVLPRAGGFDFSVTVVLLVISVVLIPFAARF